MRTKKLLMAFVLAFSVLVFTGCNILFDTTSRNSSGSTNTSSVTDNGNGTVTLCSVVTRQSSVSTTGVSLARMSKRSKAVYNKVSNSTVIVSACYTVSSKEYQMMTSGYIIDKEVKDSSTFTYYVTTSSSGIFYRYIKSVGTDGIDLDKNTTVIRSGDFEFVMADGNRYLGELVGFNDASDVAIFKFDSPMEYDVLEFADSDEINTGDEVSAIGTPTIGDDCLMNTYVKGIVAGEDRLYNVIYTDTYLGNTYAAEVASVPCFQYDAPFNNGMEGGPILNEEGKVIGSMLGDVNDSDYESLSFGVYGNVIKNVAENIIANGSYSKPLVGVTVTDVGAVIDVEGLEWIVENRAYSGLYIVSQEHNVSTYDGISPNSAADKAGMKSGEVIYKAIVNGVEKDVTGLASLSYILFQLNSGDSFQLCTINSSGVSNTYTIDLWS